VGTTAGAGALGGWVLGEVVLEDFDAAVDEVGAVDVRAGAEQAAPLNTSAVVRQPTSDLRFMLLQLRAGSWLSACRKVATGAEWVSTLYLYLRPVDPRRAGRPGDLGYEASHRCW